MNENSQPKYVRIESNEPPKQTASLKDLIKGKETGAQNAFPQRKGAPAPSTQAPSQPSNQATQKTSPLKAIISKGISSSKQVFPERKRAAAPSSQGASTSVRYQKSNQQGSSLKNVLAQTNAASTTSNAFPERKEAPAPSSQAPSPAAPKQQGGQSLKTFIAKDNTPNNAFPERKAAPSPSSQAPPPKQSASGDHAREGLTLRRYTQLRKASTSLGGLANSSNGGTPEPPKQQVEASTDETPKKQVEVPAKKETPTKKSAVKKGSSFANLASLVGNGPVVNRDRSTVNQARSVSTKLGDIAKNPAAHREEAKQKEEEVDLTKKEEYVESKDVDPQEAFQRALLSSQLANGKATNPPSSGKATKETTSLSPSKGFSSLSAIIQGRDRKSITPTINRDRSKSSLFPESSEWYDGLLHTYIIFMTLLTCSNYTSVIIFTMYG